MGYRNMLPAGSPRLVAALVCCVGVLVSQVNSLSCSDLGLRSGGTRPDKHEWFVSDNSYFYCCDGSEESLSSSVSCDETSDANYLKISSTGIPDHRVGAFPFCVKTLGSGTYDNPNTIKSQQYEWKIPKSPSHKSSAPAQISSSNTNALPMGPIGFALNGVPFFNPFNAQSQDAVSASSSGYEVMDLCGGHPQMQGGYHYHYSKSKSGCLFTDTQGQHSPKIGYAMDGYPVYGPLSDGGVAPTDLDACNGRVHATKGYIYHATDLTFPYLLGCFRGNVHTDYQGVDPSVQSHEPTAQYALLGVQEGTAGVFAPTRRPPPSGGGDGSSCSSSQPYSDDATSCKKWCDASLRDSSKTLEDTHPDAFEDSKTLPVWAIAVIAVGSCLVVAGGVGLTIRWRKKQTGRRVVSASGKTVVGVA